jgi:hypothetical protein
MVLICADRLLGSVGFLADHSPKLRRSLLPASMAGLLSRPVLSEKHVKESAFDDVGGITWENCSLTRPWQFVNQGVNCIQVEWHLDIRARTWESCIWSSPLGCYQSNRTSIIVTNLTWSVQVRYFLSVLDYTQQVQHLPQHGTCPQPTVLGAGSQQTHSSEKAFPGA